MKKYYVLAVFSIALLASCVEEFWPELKPIDERLLVVEGSINNDIGPYTIKLSTTRSIDSIRGTVQKQKLISTQLAMPMLK